MRFFSHINSHPAKKCLEKERKMILLLRTIHVLAIIATSYLLLLTNYRSAWLAGGIGVGIWLFGKPQRSTAKTLALLVITAAAIGLLFTLVDHKGFPSGHNSIHSRLSLWHALLNSWVHQRIWQGFGIVSFTSIEHLYHGLYDPTVYPHNAIVEILSPSGIIGGLITLLLGLRIFSIESQTHKITQNSSIARTSIAYLASTALLLMLDGRFYGSKSFALIYACLGVLNASAPTLPITPPSPQTGQKE